MTINKVAVAHSFSQAATTYDKHAFLQVEVAERVFERLSLMKIKPKDILDIGCGTGSSSRKLKSVFSGSKVRGIDLSEGMVEQAKLSNSFFKKIDYQVSDADELPFENNTFDLVFSNLTLQWLPNLKVTFKELNRVLKPGGLIIFSTLGPDTLIELKQSWQQVDQFVHVNHFLDMHIVGDQVFQSNFENVVMDRDIITLTYKTVLGLMKDLKGIGAHNLNDKRYKGLMGKSRFNQFKNEYEKFRSQDQTLPATYEVVYGHAWKSKDPTKQDYHAQKVSIQSPVSK